MAKYTLAETDMSDIEKEFEIEMEDTDERMFEEDSDTELEKEFETLAHEDDSDNEWEEEPDNDYGRRFYELSLKEFESETEVDGALSKILGELEKEYFFKGMFKKLKKRGLRGLVKMGMGMAKGLPVFQAIKGATQLARGDLKGLLGTVAKAGLGTMLPGGGMLTPMLSNALGFEASEDPGDNREAWRNFANMSQESYEYLARNFDSGADDPLVASELAHEAFKYGVNKAITNTQSRTPKKPRRVIKVHKGERILIVVD